MYINPHFGVDVDILLAKFKYRDRTSIVVDILGTIVKEPQGKTKTSIMRGANLNFDQANRYLELLLFNGFIKEAQPLGNQESARYKATKKGLDFVGILETRRLGLR
jgi:predicted transcriptional regulator